MQRQAGFAESLALAPAPRYSKRWQCPRRGRAQPRMSTPGYTAVLLVPTGIGAAIGGYAGDALPSARLIASVVDTLVTHPNVLNGALMYWPVRNALYVEGYALDAFAAGAVALVPRAHGSNRVGLVVDSGMGRDAMLRHTQAAEAARATLGLRVTDFVLTDRPLGVNIASGTGGVSWGGVRNPGSMLRAARELVACGCDAVAVVAQFPDDEDEKQLADYRAGNAVDAIAGAEAVISHLITRELCVPCAHAPALPPLGADETVSPKSAAEELGYTFLSCVLVGLSRAPSLVQLDAARTGRYDTRTHTLPHAVTAGDVDAAVVPADAFGGSAIMSLAAVPNVLIIAVDENETALDIPFSAVGIEPHRVVVVRNYAEAAGVLAAHKAGIDLDALKATVPKLQRQGAPRPSQTKVESSAV